jgi:hypothetical protein
MKKIKQLLNKTLLSKQLITTIFNPLSELDKSLPKRIIQYILHGDEHDVLLDCGKLCHILSNHNSVYESLRTPSAFYHTHELFFEHYPLEKAHIDFYKLWTDAYTPEQIIRFARVITALFDYLHSNELITEQIPSWFIYLLYDGLITTLPTYCEEDNKNGIIGRENWSIQQLHQFLEIEHTTITSIS